MASFLPRGVASPQDDEELPSPLEDMNLTLKKLLDKNAHLLDIIAELEGDKKHFQNKLEEYIRYEREEGGTSHDRVSHLERQVSELLAERANLQAQLVKKDKDIGDLCTSQQLQLSALSERGHRAHLLQRLNELQVSSGLNQEKHARQMEFLKQENLRLSEEVGRLRKNLADWKVGGRERPPSWELAHPYHQYSNMEGYSSLPESLPSHSEIPSIAALRLTSDPSPPLDSATASVAATELKKIKKQLEKYKTANIELDQKLKDAKLELRKYEERRSDTDVGYRMDLQRFRSENQQLRMQLDRALSESKHLRSLVGRRY